MYATVANTQKPFSTLIPYTNQQQQDHLTVRASEGPSFGDWGPLKPSSSESSRVAPAPQGNLAVPLGGLSLAPTPFSVSEGGLAQGSVGITGIQPNNTPPRQKLTPGYGDAHANCGEVRFKIVCPEDPKHYSRLAKYNCHRPACPECWTGWASRAAEDAAARIEGFALANDYPGLPRHFSFSPPPGAVDGLEDLLDKANRVLRRAGVVAACVIPHPYKLRAADTDEAPKTRSNRYTEALGADDWRERVGMFEHIHAIVYGPLPSPEAFHRMTGGWTYRNHEKGGIRGRGGEELRRTIYYLLTHAWVYGNNAVVRYWFGMSTRQLGKSKGEPYIQSELCPVCNSPCVKTPPDIRQSDGTNQHFYQDLHNAPVHAVKLKRFTFFKRARVTR